MVTNKWGHACDSLRREVKWDIMGEKERNRDIKMKYIIFLRQKKNVQIRRQ